ncbi:MAG: hypothetical protein ACE15F_21665 [bacterium]
MRKTGMCILVSMTVILGLALGAWAQPTAERSFHENTYTPEAPVYVYLTISSDAGAIGSTTVTEKPPAGWLIVKGSPFNPTVKEGEIAWNLSSRSEITLRLFYEVIPPSAATGDAVFSGKAGDREVGGTATLARVEPKPIGIFQNHLDTPETDLSWPATSGDATYNSQTGEYKVTAGGTGKFLSETGHSVYTRMSGNLSIQAKIRVESTSTELLAGFLDINERLDHAYLPDSLYAAFVTNLGCRAFWRNSQGQRKAEEFVDPSAHDGQVMIVREGNTCSMYYFNIQTQTWTLNDTRILELTDPVIVNITAFSGDPSVPATAYFTEVEIKQLASSADDWELYR